MTDISQLIPELAEWNCGNGIDPQEWILLAGRADHALGLCALLWPEVVQFEDYVLRSPIDVEQLRAWEGRHCTRQEIEAAMNAFLYPDAIFPRDGSERSLKDAQIERLNTVMVDMLSAKLARDFPQRRFAVVASGGDDFGISFHQL